MEKVKLRIRTGVELRSIDRMLPANSRHSKELKPLVAKVLRTYEIIDESRCAFSDCPASHKKGAIFELNNGDRISVGHICGRQLLEEVFDEKMREYEHGEELRMHLRVFNDLLMNRHLYRRRLTVLVKDFKLLERVRSRVLNSCPSLSQSLRQSFLNDAGKVFVDRYRTNNELEELQQLIGFPSARREEYRLERRGAGTLLGRRFYAREIERNPEFLADRLEKFLQVEGDYRLIARKHRREMFQQLSEINAAIDDCVDYVENGRAFFSERNFQLWRNYNLPAVEIATISLASRAEILVQADAAMLPTLSRAGAGKPVVDVVEIPAHMKALLKYVQKSE